ncbi:dihydrolipoyl dehydrogenase family protein [Spirosoma sp. KUDC1026]|uniref:dihydrolipoyl dehydrogenase family protein n=1 Tax=Spirosoma sp. KUDC1026 TaxID=2745947 RepID=UPI00159BEF1D|nr:NAD(P)/FAD-dependent oxidoreductase [Spirosoma sp. KUDC1026]QKZ15046.1 NAD(P)/FAD-dependent oxidoreductase [Spirosoma sp. KUDC1026]
MQTFDVVIIGTGSAGKQVAETARAAGKSVAIIDKLPFGGTCSQRGCDPKKVLVGAAEIVARSTDLKGKGITEKAVIDWSDLMAFKKTFTDSIPDSTEKKFADQGIAQFHGVASFTAKNQLKVGDETLEATHFVIAAGAAPQPLNIPGEDKLIDSTGFLELSQLPDEIVMIGGGYIAFEFAHIAARAGANVTIIHQGKRPLEQFDADLISLLTTATEDIGVRVLLDAKVTEIDGNGDQLTVRYEQDHQQLSVTTKLVVHAAGRVADVADIGLDKAGVEVSKKGVVVNEYLQSVSNPAIYACGDVSDKGKPLTPLASYEGGIVGSNILSEKSKKYTDNPVPSAVFTLPPLAAVGLTEEQATEQGLDVTVTYQETKDWYTSKRINEPVSAFKTLVDKKSGLIVGAHVLGAGSDELINVFTLAMKYKISAKELAGTLMAYPTHASNLSSMLPDE